MIVLIDRFVICSIRKIFIPCCIPARMIIPFGCGVILFVKKHVYNAKDFLVFPDDELIEESPVSDCSFVTSTSSLCI